HPVKNQPLKIRDSPLLSLTESRFARNTVTDPGLTPISVHEDSAFRQSGPGSRGSQRKIKRKRTSSVS
ncbi:hypothetical protein, partial [Rhodospira trueperi]|uniref:hypothetical protein n=1 Tax=Rhodospira trueperi TaxID=69960 RepID=UPI001C4096A4